MFSLETLAVIPFVKIVIINYIGTLKSIEDIDSVFRDVG